MPACWPIVTFVQDLPSTERSKSPFASTTNVAAFPTATVRASFTPSLVFVAGPRGSFAT